LRGISIAALLVTGSLFAGYWYYDRGPMEHRPGPVERPEPNATGPPPSRCGMTLHLAGTVSSRVTPSSYAIIDHIDGDLTHVTNVRTTTTDALPEAGDRIEVWGVVECDGPRDHIVEARRHIK
jgi:hypothetical protein